MPNEFGLDRWLIDYQEAGRSAGLRPIHDADHAIAMLSFPSPEFEIDHRDVESQKRLLREQMARFGWETPRILAHMDDAPDFYLDQVAQVVMDRWSSGRVGLLGDAAFSASPDVRGWHRDGAGRRIHAGRRARGRRLGPARLGSAGTRITDSLVRRGNQEIGRMRVQMLTAPTRMPSRARSPTWMPSPL